MFECGNLEHRNRNIIGGVKKKFVGWVDITGHRNHMMSCPVMFAQTHWNEEKVCSRVKCV